MPLKKIKKQKIGDLVLDQINMLILSREWPPGSKIPSENEIAQMMSVSRVSVRSALQKLSSLGIVESRQGEGTFVCKYEGSGQINKLLPMVLLSEPDLEAMNEFRLIFECQSARLAAERCTPEQLQKLVENHNNMRQISAQGQDNSDLDFEFHLLMAKASHNRYIVQTILVLKELIFASIKAYKATYGFQPSVDYHKKILDAIIQKQPDAAYEAMRAHLLSNITGPEAPNT